MRPQQAVVPQACDGAWRNHFDRLKFHTPSLKPLSFSILMDRCQASRDGQRSLGGQGGLDSPPSPSIIQLPEPLVWTVHWVNPPWGSQFQCLALDARLCDRARKLSIGILDPHTEWSHRHSHTALRSDFCVSPPSHSFDPSFPFGIKTA